MDKKPIALAFILVVFFICGLASSKLQTLTVLAVLWGRIIDKVLQETIYILKFTKEVLYSLTLTLTPANNIVFIVYTAYNHFQQVFQTDQPLGLALVIHNNSDVEPASLKFLQ